MTDEIVRTLIKKADRGRNPEDYTGPDGLLVCGKCHTPKRSIHKMPNGEDITVSVLCSCEKERIQRDEEIRQTRERYENTHTLPVFSLHDRYTKKWTFDQDDRNNKKASTAARCYVEHWPEVKKKGVGLLFLGSPGTGKSFMAACIANALQSQMVPVLFTGLGKLIRAVTTMTGDRNEYLRSLCAFDLLILDDLGAERQSSFADEVVFEVIDERIKSGLPMIVSTNLTAEQLTDKSQISHSRIYDRILSTCVPVAFEGESRRKSGAEDRLRWMRDMLEK